MMEYRSLKRSKEDNRNQYELEKRPRSEASPTRDRLSPDHAVRAVQLREQQRRQEQQGSGNQDTQAGSSQQGREVRLFGMNIAGDQRMDEKSKETASSFFKEAELNSYHEGYQKPLDERSVKEARAVAMYEVIIGKCFKNNEQDLIQPFFREVRQLDLYKQAYGRKKSSFQQQEGPHFEEDREKLPKQKQTSPSWSHEGEKRQSHQAWEKEKKEVIDISSNSDSESDHGRTDHQADISRAREEYIKKGIDDIMKTKEKFTRKNIKQYLEDHQLCGTDSVEIAIKHLQEKWSRYQNDSRYNNIIFAINGITY